MTDEPANLVVVGAAAGMGRWLVDHLLLGRSWDRVVLVDTATSVGSITPTDSATEVAATGDPLDLSTRGWVVVLAVPLEAVDPVMAWLAPLLASDAVVGVVSANQAGSLTTVAGRWPAAQSFGIHPLFDASARTAEGQTLLLVGPEGRPSVAWLHDLIASAGAIADAGSAADHDAIMHVVQTATHQSLVTFADMVTSSGVDLEKLWEARTPVFEGLFGLAARVLVERQQATIAGIQATMGGASAIDQLGAAIDRWRRTVDGPPEEIEASLAAIRDRFSGTLFDTIQATAATSVSAAQAKRAELARHRRLGSLVGIRPANRPDSLRVGRIVDVTPVAVTLREVMVGKEGRAVLLDGPGRRNAAKVGVNGVPTDTRFGLGHVEIVVGDELSESLDRWLTSVRRDVRFLVPESIAGAGVLTIVSTHPGVRDADVVSEVVRTGQRAVNVRVHIRVDHDVDDMVEQLRGRVEDTYEWPKGIALSTAPKSEVHYLGPAGTFSEVAAVQAQASIAPDSPLLTPRPHDDFGSVLRALDPDSLAVLPISSSTSGLVGRSVRALLDHDGEVSVGGVVDVAVRLDAYVKVETQLADLRGARVFSHPQALGQCEQFIRRLGLRPEPCKSTTEALHVANELDEPCVAIAGTGTGHPSGLKVGEREIDDISGAITRFLILGAPRSFGTVGDHSDPTLRSIWVADSVGSVLSMIEPGAPAFDELLSDADGCCLWVTSRPPGPNAPAGARHLGRAPWSPRTPVVRVEVDVAR